MRKDELSSFYFYRGKPKLLFFNVNFISYHSASLSQPGLLVSFHLEICQAPNIKCQSIFTFEIAVLHAFRFLFHLMTTLVRINSYKNFIHFPQIYVNRCIYPILLLKQLVRVDHDAPHLPHGHLAVVGVRVVVPLDRRQVGVEVEECGR